MLIFSDFAFCAILFLLQSTSLLQNASQQNGVLCYLYNLFQNLIKNSRFCKMYRLMLHLANALAYSVLTAAGKSTLLHILSGTDTPDSGTILFDGKNLLKNPSLQSTKIGYVAQNNPLFPDMTAMDHLKLWYSATEYSIEDDLKDGFLSILKIEPFLHKKAKTLSAACKSAKHCLRTCIAPNAFTS